MPGLPSPLDLCFISHLYLSSVSFCVYRTQDIIRLILSRQYFLLITSHLESSLMYMIYMTSYSERLQELGIDIFRRILFLMDSKTSSVPTCPLPQHSTLTAGSLVSIQPSQSLMQTIHERIIQTLSNSTSSRPPKCSLLNPLLTFFINSMKL